MKLTTWLEKKAVLSEEYERLTAEGMRLVLRYDQGEVDAHALLVHCQKLDTAYLAICAEQCDQCLFSKNKIVSAARKRQVIREARQDQGYFICHKTQETCCRGFFDAYGWGIQIYRIASRLGPQFVVWVGADGEGVIPAAYPPLII